MPELPEAERARQTLEAVLGRRIASVDDQDRYVCRPHAPGEIASALIGHELISAHRRGKFLWLETADGPTLGLHLGMAGRILVNGQDETSRWDRFAVEFDDGTRFALRDKRRLSRAVLNPDFSHVGPDAANVGREEFQRLIGWPIRPCGRPESRRCATSLSCPERIWVGSAASFARRSARRSAGAGFTPARSSRPAGAKGRARAALMRSSAPPSADGPPIGARCANAEAPRGGSEGR